jgi:hypothetical protein
LIKIILIKIALAQNDIYLILEYGVQHFIFMFDIPISFQKKKNESSGVKLMESNVFMFPHGK